MRLFLTLLFCSLVKCKQEGKEVALYTYVGIPLYRALPCNGSDDISISFEPVRPPENENEYTVFINKKFHVSSRVEFKFDAETIVTLVDKSYARLYAIGYDNGFRINFYREHNNLAFHVKGALFGVVPYFRSLKISGTEYCSQPWTGVLDEYVLGYKDHAVSGKKPHDKSCGRRKVSHTELIVNGASTKPGDWPWHVAIYRYNKASFKYICGGTLLSTTYVLTAAHCTTIRGVPVVPEILNVVLAKYNLMGGDVAAQEREVLEIIVHEDFKVKKLENDISMLKLKTVAVFDDYIQPACLWYEGIETKLPRSNIDGTVVGWGFDRSDALSKELLQAKLPILPDTTCIRRNPVFYSQLLNTYKFCAGLQNGTSPCNGDSGGGFVVFVPDTRDADSRDSSGAWYVRGIVSVTVSRTDAPICDPEQYVVFTDVAKYRTWIESYLK